MSHDDHRVMVFYLGNDMEEYALVFMHQIDCISMERDVEGKGKEIYGSFVI